MSQPVAQCSLFNKPAGPVSVTPPSGFVLSVFFKVVASPTEPVAADIVHYWIAVGDSNTITTEHDGGDVFRIDVPAPLIQEVSTHFFAKILKEFKNPNLPPGTPIIRP